MMSQTSIGDLKKKVSRKKVWIGKSVGMTTKLSPQDASSQGRTKSHQVMTKISPWKDGEKSHRQNET